MLSGFAYGLLAFTSTGSGTSLDPSTLTGGVTLFTALMAVAVIVGVGTKIMKLPYTVALVLAGLFIAILQRAPVGAELHPNLVFYIILPPVLFRAGLLIDVKSLGRHWIPVFLMTFAGTILTTVIVGFAIHWALSPDLISPGTAWVAALMIGAMVSPTDPVSVMPIIRSIRLPKSIRTTIEGESLFNDGIAVVLFFILYGAIFMPISEVVGGDGPNQSQPVITAATAAHEQPIVGTDVSLVHSPKSDSAVDIWAGIMLFLGNTGIGLCLGGVLGLGAVYLMRWADDPVLENTITVVLAYGAFIIASNWSASGVAAVIVAGILVGVLRCSKDKALESERTIVTFWESIDYIMNSLIFLIVGFELQFIGVGTLLEEKVVLAVLAVFGAMLLARALVVFPCGHFSKAWNARGGTIVFWAGLRGCVTLALVLVLPDNVEGRPDALKEFLLPLVFGVVLLTLILQATTMRPLFKLLRIEEQGDSADA
ncbi:MAG: sodium:proton antiporter [Phycisphaerales bacterium]|nr:sodium:proton antiporter [Phycisphaerales bacterium]